MAILVPTWLNDLFYALMGERLPQANEDLAYMSHEAFKAFADRLRKLGDLITESIGYAGKVLPPRIADNYVRGVHVLTDDGGTNHITEFAKQLDDISDGRVKTSMDIAESKINILFELAILAAELLFLSVMAAFTFGSTSAEATEAKLRTRAEILVLLDLLAKRIHLMPTLSETLEEMFSTLGSRLALILTAAPGRKPHGIDMKDVLLSGLTGGLTSILDHLIHSGKGLFKGLFKSKADIGAGFDKKFTGKDKMYGLNSSPGRNAVAHEGRNLTPGGPLSGASKFGSHAAEHGFDAIAEGGAETFAEAAVYQQPLSFSTFHGAVVSSMNTGLMFAGAHKLSLGFRDSVFPGNLDVTPNSVSARPDTGTAGANGAGTAVSGPGKGAPVPTTGTGVPAPAPYARAGLTETGPAPVATTSRTDTPDVPHVSAGPDTTGTAHGAGPATVNDGEDVSVRNTGEGVTHDDRTVPDTSAGDGANTRPPAGADAGRPTTLSHNSGTGPVTGPGKTARAPSGPSAVTGGSVTQHSPDAQDVSAARPDTESATGPVTTGGGAPAVSAGHHEAPAAPTSAGPAAGPAAGTNPPATVKADGDPPVPGTSAPATGQDRPTADADRSTEQESSDTVATVSGTTHPAVTADATVTHAQDTTVGPVGAEDSADPGITPLTTVSASAPSRLPGVPGGRSGDGTRRDDASVRPEEQRPDTTAPAVGEGAVPGGTAVVEPGAGAGGAEEVPGRTVLGAGGEAAGSRTGAGTGGVGASAVRGEAAPGGGTAVRPGTVGEGPVSAVRAGGGPAVTSEGVDTAGPAPTSGQDTPARPPRQPVPQSGTGSRADVPAPATDSAGAPPGTAGPGEGVPAAHAPAPDASAAEPARTVSNHTGPQDERLTTPFPTSTVSQAGTADPDRVTAVDHSPAAAVSDLTTGTGASVGVTHADRAALLRDLNRRARRFGKLRAETAVKPAADAHLLLAGNNVTLPSVLPGDGSRVQERARILRDAVAMALHEGPRNEAQALTVTARTMLDLHAPRTVVGGAPTGLDRDTVAAPSRTAPGEPSAGDGTGEDSVGSPDEATTRAVEILAEHRVHLRLAIGTDDETVAFREVQTSWVERVAAALGPDHSSTAGSWDEPKAHAVADAIARERRERAVSDPRFVELDGARAGMSPPRPGHNTGTPSRMLRLGSGGHGVGGLLWNQGVVDRENALSARYGVRIGPSRQRPHTHFSHSTLSRIEGVLAGLPPEHLRGLSITPGPSSDGSRSSVYEVETQTVVVVAPYQLPSWVMAQLNRGSDWQLRVMDRVSISEHEGISRSGDRALGLAGQQRQVMAGVSDVLAHGNFMKWLVRHEVGHHVDQLGGWMKDLIEQSRFGGWRVYNNRSHVDLVRNVLVKFGLGDGSGPPSRNGLSLLAEVAEPFHPQDTADRPRLFSALREAFSHQPADFRNRLENVIRFGQLAFAHPWMLADGGGDLLDIDGRMHHVTDDNRWVSYLRSERDNHSVSNYQFSKPMEWFAEAYAAFYDPDPAPRGRLHPHTVHWFATELPVLLAQSVPGPSGSSGAFAGPGYTRAYPYRPDADWETKSRRVLQDALVNAVARGEIGTAYTNGLVRALQASGAGLVSAEGTGGRDTGTVRSVFWTSPVRGLLPPASATQTHEMPVQERRALTRRLREELFPQEAGSTGGTTDADVRRRWSPLFAQAHTNLGMLGRHERDQLLAGAGRIMAGRHQPPPLMRADVTPGSPEAAYLSLYDDMAALVADRLRRSPRPDLPPERQPARLLSELLREDFGTRATSGGVGGGPGKWLRKRLTGRRSETDPSGAGPSGAGPSGTSGLFQPGRSGHGAPGSTYPPGPQQQAPYTQGPYAQGPYAPGGWTTPQAPQTAYRPQPYASGGSVPQQQVQHGPPLVSTRPRDWPSVLDMQWREGNNGGVHVFGSANGGQAVVKFHSDAASAVYADEFIRSVSGVHIPTSRVLVRGSTDAQAMESLIARHDPYWRGTRRALLDDYSHITVTELAEGTPLSRLSVTERRALVDDVDSLRLIGGLMMVTDSFLGRPDRLWVAPTGDTVINWDNVIYSARQRRVTAIDNDTAFMDDGFNAAAHAAELERNWTDDSIEWLANVLVTHPTGFASGLGRAEAAVVQDELEQGAREARGRIGSRALRQGPAILRHFTDLLPQEDAPHPTLTEALARYAHSRWDSRGATRRPESALAEVASAAATLTPYPPVDLDVRERWAGHFQQAWQTLNRLDSRTQGRLLAEAGRIMAGRHQAPPLDRTGPAGAPQHPYSALHHDMTVLIAETLHDYSGRPDAVQQAQTVSEQLRREFGTQATRGGVAGARGPATAETGGPSGGARPRASMVRPDESAPLTSEAGPSAVRRPDRGDTTARTGLGPLRDRPDADTAEPVVDGAQAPSPRPDADADAASPPPRRTQRRVRVVPPALDLRAPDRPASRPPVGPRTSATLRTPRAPGPAGGTADTGRKPTRTSASGDQGVRKPARTPRTAGMPRSARPSQGARTPMSTGTARSARFPRTPRTPVSGVPARTPRTPVSPGHVRTSAVHAMRSDPRQFMSENVISLNMAAGLQSYAPRLSSEQATRVVAALNDTSLRRHWFVLVEVGRDTSGKPEYVLAPAVEKYAQHYPHVAAFSEIPPGRLPAMRKEPSYLQAGFIPYLTGATSDLDKAIGHTEVVRDPSDVEFSPDFVVTPTMNGCALAVTAGSAPGRFTAWHFQSPSAFSNVANAEMFRKLKRPTDWYGDGEYYEVTPPTPSGKSGPMFETTNMLWRGPDGWEVLSQENRTGHTSKKVTLRRFQHRPLRLAEGGELHHIASVYQGLARAEVFEDNKIDQRYRNIMQTKPRNPQKEEAETYTRIETIYNLMRSQVEDEMRRIGEASDFQSLHRLAADFRRDRAAFMPTFEKALPELRGNVSLPLFNKQERLRIERRVENTKELVRLFLSNEHRDWITRMETEAGEHAGRPVWDRLPRADRAELNRLVAGRTGREADADLARLVEDAYRELPDSWYSQPLVRRAELIVNKITTGRFFHGLAGAGAQRHGHMPDRVGEPSTRRADDLDQSSARPSGAAPDHSRELTATGHGADFHSVPAGPSTGRFLASVADPGSGGPPAVARSQDASPAWSAPRDSPRELPRPTTSGPQAVDALSVHVAAPGEPGPAGVDYGKIGGEFETEWRLAVPEEFEHGEPLARNSRLELTVEQMGDLPPILEIVGRPITYQNEVSGVEESEFWESLEATVQTLRSGATVHSLFGAHNGFARIQDAGLWVQPGRELVLSAQWTVGMHPSELLDFLVDDAQPMAELSPRTARRDVEAGAAFAKEVAGRFFADTHGVGMLDPAVAWHLLDDVEYRSLAGLLTLVFTHAVTGVRYAADRTAGRQPKRWLKSYLFVASRHDPSTLARRLTRRTRDYLDANNDYVLRKFTEHAQRATDGGYRGDPLDASFLEGARVRDYLQSFTLYEPSRIVRQENLSIYTVFSELDNGKVLVEVREFPDVDSVAQARETYETLKKRAHHRHETAARRTLSAPGSALSTHRAVSAGTDLAGPVGRLVRSTDVLDSLRRRQEDGHRPLWREEVGQLVRRALALESAGRAGQGPRHLPDEQERAHASTVLRDFDTRLTEFATHVSISAPAAWQELGGSWAQAMAGVSWLHEVLTGERRPWPPGTLDDVAPSGSEAVDDAVARAVQSPGDTTALRDILYEVRVWGREAGGEERAFVVRDLEHRTLHLLVDAETEAENAARPNLTPASLSAGAGADAGQRRWPEPSAEALEKWAEPFGNARDFLYGAENADELRQRARRIVDEHHMVPLSRQEDPSAGASAYRKLHGRVVDLVALFLHRKGRTVNAEAGAARLARETAEAFGSRPAPDTTGPVVQVWSADTGDA